MSEDRESASIGTCLIDDENLPDIASRIAFVFFSVSPSTLPMKSDVFFTITRISASET